MKSTKQISKFIAVAFALGATALTATVTSARDVSSVLGRGAPVIHQGSATIGVRIAGSAGVAAVQNVQGRSPVAHLTQVSKSRPQVAAKRGVHVSEVQGRAGSGA